MRTILLLLISLRLTAGPDDKTIHCVVGAAMTIGIGELTYELTSRPGLSCLIGFITSCSITWTKENIWDKRLGKGVYDVMDKHFGYWGAATGFPVIRVVIDIRENRWMNKNIESHI